MDDSEVISPRSISLCGGKVQSVSFVSYIRDSRRFGARSDANACVNLFEKSM
jgi:hypothetical protein